MPAKRFAQFWSLPLSSMCTKFSLVASLLLAAAAAAVLRGLHLRISNVSNISRKLGCLLSAWLTILAISGSESQCYPFGWRCSCSGGIDWPFAVGHRTLFTVRTGHFAISSWSGLKTLQFMCAHSHTHLDSHSVSTPQAMLHLWPQYAPRYFLACCDKNLTCIFILKLNA